MKLKNKVIISGLTMVLSVSVWASQTEKNEMRAVQNQYDAYVDNGKSYKDAYAALAYEIAYETAAVAATKPCRKMVRGL
ncbi:MAG TPA: hypothetical protein ENK73_00620 [Thiomicrospira sp.]|jgi:type II secretory pathway component PulF|nr:hypothetical protein [Thiomicrospira sp.]